MGRDALVWMETQPATTPPLGESGHSAARARSRSSAASSRAFCDDPILTEAHRARAGTGETRDCARRAEQTRTEKYTMDDQLLEIEETHKLRREEAAAKLRNLADQLSRHNQVEFVRDGTRYTVRVPDDVELKFEIEIGDSTEIEIEISW